MHVVCFFLKNGLLLRGLTANKLILKKLFLVLLLTWGLSLSVNAQGGYIINNYTRNDYHAGSQNWQIAQSDNHWIYFANKMGVLEFNGRDWRLYPLENNTDTRSLYYSRKDQRIYTGGINEFGYLAPDNSGEMHYHNLWDSGKSPEYTFGNIWNVFEIDNSLYFCEDHVVLKYTADTLILIPGPDKIDCSALVNNTLYIGTPSGVFILAGEAFYRLPHTEALQNKKLRAILPYENRLLIATAREGLFLWDHEKLETFHIDADDFIRENELFSIDLQEDKIAIGTVLRGVVILSREGRLISYINESHGLQNNTVLSTFFDKNGDLWLGLDNGIDYVALNSPIRTLYSSAKFYGAGYAARLYKNKLYLGTNRGLYVCEWPIPNRQSAPDLTLVDGTQGQVWNLKIIGDELMMAHDRGLFAIKPDGIEAIDSRAGVWDIHPIKDDPDNFWVSNYNGFYILQKRNDKRCEIPDFYLYSGSYINSRSYYADNLFLRSNRIELLHVKIDRDKKQIEKEQTYRPESIPEDFLISQINDTIILSGQSGFYYYNGKDDFVAHDTLNRHFPTTVHSGLYRHIEKNNKKTWVLGNNMLAYKEDEMEVPRFYEHNIPLITNFERLFPLNDSLVVIPNENGFALWKTSQIAKKPHYPLQITKVFFDNSRAAAPGHNLVSLDGIPEIPYRYNSLFVWYSQIRYLNPHKVQFQTQLDNEPWTDYSQLNARNLPNIPVGKHIFRVRTQSDGFEIMETTFQFIILPPWYRTVWAYFGYLFLLILIVFFIRRWDYRRIERKKLQLRIAQKEELKKREEEFQIENEKKEEEIVRLKNEQLEMDLKYKSQKLATSAIVLGRKNEVLINLKEELLKLFEETKEDDFDHTILKRKILQINSKIDTNIHEDDSFQKFEENFDLVHNNFIKRLASSYPSLSITEQKMCAYIKMQLSSKEIAPLLNISVRGAETLRYRLRKKLELKREDSLTQFLMNF